MSAELSVLAVTYVKVPVRVTESGASVDPTGATVQMAFTASDVDPVSGDWKTASWETDATTTPDTYLARCLVGSAVTLAVGTYDVWVKILASPETVVDRAGFLKVV
ncbi:hypothetical protein Rhe02_54870 [Rhizocola hellebori]|uniref:Uncharacterized protein n=1 Tax=Rhizocola hellebori TaxID=1392758 RepID=A0A8J3VIB1_9ACTN|nr:hypothetical protein [Rhizocola hellebori]GIH07420.1 hypothetical protein Rhe02_54870 [Rhizocola hellebori]